MASNRAQAIKAERRKTVTFGAHSYTIRKLTNRDFMPDGVVLILSEDAPKEQRLERAKKYWEEHPPNPKEVEDRVLTMAIIDPRITPTGEEDDAIALGDLGDDRVPLIDAICEFSGYVQTKEEKKSDAPVAPAERSPAGDPGEALRETPVGTP